MSWLDVLSWTSVALGFLTAGIISVDLIAHPQKMRIMNIVWPVTGLYFPLVGLWFYHTMGRPMAADAPAMKGERPYWKGIFVSATHCGSGDRRYPGSTNRARVRIYAARNRSLCGIRRGIHACLRLRHSLSVFSNPVD